VPSQIYWHQNKLQASCGATGIIEVNINANERITSKIMARRGLTLEAQSRLPQGLFGYE